MASVTPFLMFKDQAEEAVKFYVSIFRNSSIGRVSHFTAKEIQTLMRVPAEWRPGPAGQVKVISFTLNGQPMYAGNGGAYFSFNHGISLYARCETQGELDEIWEKLSEGGAIEECGWLTDRFGVSWQVAPADLERWTNDPDPEKAERVYLAVLASKKLDFETLERAYDGR